MSKLTWVLAVLCAAFGLVALSGPALAEGDVHWSYEGEAGPAHWGELSHEFALCADGTEQSPVDVPSTAKISPANIVFSYQPSALELVNNGHTVQANYAPGSSITVDGKAFTLVQLHFHAPSEHKVAGDGSDLELHLVHKAADGELAVVGVMIDPGTENAAYAPVLKNLPAQAGDPVKVDGVTVDAAQLLPAARDYYRYDGSLTTPPCTEGVNWFVMKDPVQLSAAQIALFTAIYHNNARPVQDLKARVFYDPNAPAKAAAQAAPAAQPAALPRTGGVALPLATLLTNLGALMATAGLYLRRRRVEA